MRVFNSFGMKEKGQVDEVAFRISISGNERPRHRGHRFISWLAGVRSKADIAEGIGRHRGMKICKKKTLVSVILSNLRRSAPKEKPTRKFP